MAWVGSITEEVEQEFEEAQSISNVVVANRIESIYVDGRFRWDGYSSICRSGGRAKSTRDGREGSWAPRTPTRDVFLAQFIARGETPPVIGVRLPITPIERYMLGLPPQSNHRLPQEKVDAIRFLGELGFSLREIASKVGVAKTTVTAYLGPRDRTAGMKRFHARRREEGRPVVPPRRYKKCRETA